MKKNDMMKLIKVIIITINLVLLSSCSLLSPVKKPSNTYFLNQIPCDIPQKPKGSIKLVVAAPEARPMNSTTNIVYSLKPYKVAYYSENEWAETPSQMLQQLIVQTLQKTNHYTAVISAPYFGSYDYTLTTQILFLQQIYTVNPPVVQFTLRAQLAKSGTNELIAIKQFEINQPVHDCTPYSGVLATNMAVSKILAELTDFVLAHT